MSKRKHYYSKSTRRISKSSKNRTIKPGADAGLKKVFASIGLPPKKAFTPDRFQTEALAAVEQTDCLVTAPTGAGKTWIAEQAIRRIRKRDGQAWYACPLKALSNSKYSEFKEIFGEHHVGILTGDRRENSEAPIIVGTTEILRNQLYDAMHLGKSLPVDFVVLDEVHFLGDEERGVVWEEIMIYLPQRIPLLMLSATIGNARQIAAWLESIRSKPCTVIAETIRPVPLFPLFFHPSGTLLPFTKRAKGSGQPQLDKKVKQFINGGRRRTIGYRRKLPPFVDILKVLKKYDLTPAIFFLKSRADCDRALDSCRDNLKLDVSRQQWISRKFEKSFQHIPHIARHRQRWHLEQMAIGAHHSGQLPAWKLVLEQMMTEGLLDAVFATSTVSAGVNFPARTIVFFNSDRFNGKQFLPLTPTEFHQMTGRAGRRGMDKIGFALIVPDKFMDVKLIQRLLSSRATDITSQIKINFSMVLNLLLSHNPEQIEVLLKRSFANYLSTKSKHRKNAFDSHKDIWRDFLRHLNFLKATGFVTDEDRLTQDGIWASQLRVDQPLLIAEGFRQGLFPQSNAEILAAITATFVYEREIDDRVRKKFLPNQLARSFHKVTRGLKPFASKLVQHKFEVRPQLMRPAATIYAWAMGNSWENVLGIAEMEEGDLAMLILRTADNLRHIRNLKDVFPDTATDAAKAIEKILREPVPFY